jgi:hypothetical protein
MGTHEKRCIYIDAIDSFEIDVRDINLKERGDVFFRAYVLINDDWSSFKEWEIDNRKSSTRANKEANRLKAIYNSVKEKGYVYDYHDKTRDMPITVIKGDDGGYFILNGSCRMASILSLGIDRIMVREISNEIAWCCKRMRNINKRFGLEKGYFMSSVSDEIKTWIEDFKNEYYI